MATRTVSDHKYTAEQNAWLRANIGSYRYKDLVRVFNEQFGTSLSYDALTSYCLKKLRIKRGKDKQHRFAKGKQSSKHTLPIGAEKWDGKILWVKISDDLIEEQRIVCQKALNPNWKPKKQVVWEQHHGAIPDGMMLVHLNRNRRDCSIENLYLTTRQINLMMAKNGWYSENPELTKTALKWCELFYAMKG